MAEMLCYRTREREGEREREKKKGRERVLTRNIINGHPIIGNRLNTTNWFTENVDKRFRNKYEHHFTSLTFFVAKLKIGILR